MSDNSSDLFNNPPVDIYTRAAAIENGTLIDATEQARTVGFRIPVAIAEHAYRETIACYSDATDEPARLGEVLQLALEAAATTAIHTEFAVCRRDHNNQPVPITLTIQVRPGDDPQPVATITHHLDE